MMADLCYNISPSTVCELQFHPKIVGLNNKLNNKLKLKSGKALDVS